jgi:hypothetical protein
MVVTYFIAFCRGTDDSRPGEVSNDMSILQVHILFVSLIVAENNFHATNLGNPKYRILSNLLALVSNHSLHL